MKKAPDLFAAWPPQAREPRITIGGYIMCFRPGVVI